MFKGQMLTGLAALIRKYQARAPSPVGERDYFESTLVATLGEWPEKALFRKSRELTTAIGGTEAKRISETLRILYNQKSRKYRLA